MKHAVMPPLLASVVAAATSCFAQPPVLFRSESRLVEVYATVLDHKGRYIDGLSQASFQVTDNGAPQPIVAFESNAGDLSCAILLDTTGSMGGALPAVKNAVVRLLDEFRDDDWITAYSFGTALDLLQDFTRDKAAVKQAVLRTRAAGATALFDALSRVAGNIAGRSGKKAVIVFTDGDDNASVLNAQRAVERAKKVGVPVYTVAWGQALNSRALMEELTQIAHFTGGRTYTARQPHQIGSIFEDISAELQHTYLLTYKPPESRDASWRQIQVSVRGRKDYAIRAKEGYFPF